MCFRKKSSDYKFRQEVTDEHPHNEPKTFYKSCKTCINNELLKQSKVIPCPDCDLYTLKQRLFRFGKFWDLEFYCVDCDEVWRRVNE